MRCTEVADRPFPDGWFSGRDIGDRGRSSKSRGVLNLLRLFFASALFIAFQIDGLAQDEDLTITVRLLDPRIVSNTSETMRIEWEDYVTDIVASRTLTKSERAKLNKYVDAELTSDKNVPLCGHFPAYAIIYRNKDGSVAKTKTISNLCMTWASENTLKRIKGKRTIEYLKEVLPLPDYFEGANLKNDVAFAKNKNVPYFDLEKKK